MIRPFYFKKLLNRHSEFLQYDYGRFSLKVVNFLPDDPNNDPNICGDPYKTLFVARLVSTIVILGLSFQIFRNIHFINFSNSFLLSEL